MRRYTLPLALLSFLITATALFVSIDGHVDNKQAPPRIDGEGRVYRLHVDGSWIIVPSDVWERCSIYERFPVCALSSPPQ